MGNPAQISTKQLGFLKVIDLEELGYCGGLLIVSPLGRPVEFHCTAPIARNRAQEIMYGQTYQSFLFTEQIGLALLDKSRQQPDALIVESEPLSLIKSLVQLPVLWLDSQPTNADRKLGWQDLDVNGETILAHNVDQLAITELRNAVNNFRRTLPLREPFERISIAIEEANQVLRAG